MDGDKFDGIPQLPDVIAFDYGKACELLIGRGYKVITRLTCPPRLAGRNVPVDQPHVDHRNQRVVRERLIGPGEVELILVDQ
ncbi:MAG: hypothetical protein ACM3TT_04385 [Syntrophothermus sp.]